MPLASDVVAHITDVERVRRQVCAADATWVGPAAGSSMAADDQVWRTLPCSEVVRNALLSGHDHLDMVVRVLLDETRSAPPVAIFSALRGALVGACLALWVVGCEDTDQRRARALALVAEDHRHRRAYHRSQALSQDPDRAAFARPWVDRWTSRLTELEDVRSHFPTVSTGTTSIIEWVAREMFPASSDAPATLLGLWQTGSSAAHGLGWGVAVRPALELVATDSERGLSAFEVRLVAEDTADRFSACAALLVLAHDLLQDRSRN